MLERWATCKCKMPPACFSRLKSASRLGNLVRAGGKKESENCTEILAGQSRLLGGIYRLSACTVGGSVLLPQGVCRRPSAVDKRKGLSVVGLLSRTFSVPSVSGPSCEVCVYHIDRLSLGYSPTPISYLSQRKVMATCSPLAVRANLSSPCLGNSFSRTVHTSGAQSSLSCGSKSLQCFGKASMSVKNGDSCDGNVLYGYFLFNLARKSRNPSIFASPGLRNFLTARSSQHAVGAAPDIPLDGPSKDEQLVDCASSSDQ